MAVSLAALALLSCGEAGERALGPASPPADASAGLSADVVPGTNITLPAGCLDYADPSTATAGVQSPCDAARNDGFPGVYLLPPLVGSVPTEGTFQSGLADLLTVTAEEINCDPAVGRCDPYELSVTENAAGQFYETAWKTTKRGPNAPPAESDWRILVQLDLGTDTIPMAYRDVTLSSTPSTDQPADEPLLVIQLGSNQPVKFFITSESCNNTGDVTVTCLIGDGGGTLFIGGDGNPNVAFTVGAGNGARLWTAEFVEGDVDVDVPVFGRTVRVTASPEPSEALIGSSILFCEDDQYITPGNAILYVLQQDENGSSALPPIQTPDCSLFPTPSASGVLDLLGGGLESLASLVVPQPLIATSAVGALSGGGGSVKRLSDFELGLLGAADPLGDDPYLGEAFVTSTGNPTFTAQVNVTNPAAIEAGDPAGGLGSATIWFYPDEGGTLSCPSTATTPCTVHGTGEAEVETDDLGAAVIDWTPGAVGRRELKALGCGIAVAGAEPTLASGVYGLLQDEKPGETGTCDRSPASTEGHANGPAAGTDPFEPIDAINEVALNDLPITFTADVTCDALEAQSVTCKIDDGGGVLRIGGGDDPKVEVEIGPDNGTYDYTVEFAGGDIDVDVPLFGPAVRVFATDGDGNPVPSRSLNASTIFICNDTDYLTPGATELYVWQQDDVGTSVLPPPEGRDCTDVNDDWPADPAAQSLLDLMGDGLEYVASLFAPKPLIATSAVGALSGGGGSVKRLSEFQLGLSVAAAAEALDLGTIKIGNTVTAQVNVTNPAAVDLGSNPTGAIGGATVHFEAVSGGTVSCVAGAVDCDDTAGTKAIVKTGSDGVAQVEWSPSSVASQLTALGCGIAVAGAEPTLANGVYGLLQDEKPGQTGTCDRSPAGNEGHANGPIDNTTDPFEPIDAINEVAINDLPIAFIADVCDTQATAVADGIREAAWDCATSTPFPVNLRGGGQNQPDATLLWMNDDDNLYLAVQLPRDSDETDTSLWFEFDLGDGSAGPDGQADANDDLIGVVRTKSAAVFRDSYVDAGCAASNGQSVCDPTDPEAAQHVTGDVGAPFAENGTDTNGQFMFYEIAHPLCNDYYVGENQVDERARDFCVTPDSDGEANNLGLFLRLSVGKNSQGGTTWPEFRDYWDIDIKN